MILYSAVFNFDLSMMKNLSEKNVFVIILGKNHYQHRHLFSLFIMINSTKFILIFNFNNSDFFKLYDVYIGMLVLKLEFEVHHEKNFWF